MAVVQDVFAFGLAFGVAALYLFYAGRQLRSLRRLRETPDAFAEETSRERHQCWRRLAGSILLLLIAVLIAAAQLWLEERAQRLADRDKTQFPLTADEKTFLRFYTSVWITVLVLLFAVIVLAAFDVWAIRRYGRIQHRKIRDARRDMIAHQLQRLREERGGQ